MSGVVRRVPVDEGARAWLPGAGYACAFTLRTPVSATPEQWARAVFEGGPALWRALLWVGWRFGLGLRLGPRHTPRFVQGWTIESSDAASIVLAAESRLLSARSVFVVDGGTVTWTTIVRASTRLGGLLWRAAAPVHQATVPFLLRRARPLSQ